MITVALPKGALLKDSIRSLQAVGLDFSAVLDSANRQLQIQYPSGTAQHFQLHDGNRPRFLSNRYGNYLA